MPRGDPPMSLEALVPYYNGVYFATVALKERFGKMGPEGRAAVQTVSHFQQMVMAYREALQQTIALKRG